MAEKKIIKQITLKNENEKALSLQVNHLINQGWSLSGEMQIASAGTSHILGGAVTTTFSREMVLYEGDAVQLPLSEHDKFKTEFDAMNSGCLVFIILGASALFYLLIN